LHRDCTYWRFSGNGDNSRRAGQIIVCCRLQTIVQYFASWLIAPVAGVHFTAEEHLQEEFCADLDRA
jgi:hypothetical protein